MIYKKHLFLVLASLMLATPVSAATVPVFDWVAARTDSLIGLQGGFSVAYTPAVDSADGSIYISNFFTGTPDFDPGAGTDSIASNGEEDNFLSKFDSNGAYLWTKTWGGTGRERTLGATVDGNGNVYSVGTFSSTVDFDPGAGTFFATSTGGTDNFVSKFDSDGNFIWAKTWGNASNQNTLRMVTTNDTGDVFVHGHFTGTVDFDPSAGTAFATSTAGNDIFLSKFDSDGNFEWVKAWGGTGDDGSSGVKIANDGALFFTGIFTNTIDLDPSVATASSTSAGSYDRYFLKLSTTGDLVYAKTWGGTGFDSAGELQFGNGDAVYVFGGFSSTVDFDPGPGEAFATSTGGLDAYFSKFDADGNFEWVKTWGGSGTDVAVNAVVNENTLTVVGYFSSTVDFDPSAGTDSKVSVGGLDVAISTYSPDGTYIRTDTFGGSLDDFLDSLPQGVAFGSDTLVLAAYYKSAPADFDPGPGVSSASSNGTSLYISSLNLVEASVGVSPTSGTAEEGGDTLTYDIVLNAPPTDDVVITVTPDSQLSVSTTTLTFASTTWDTPQTVTVTAVDDEENEDDPHTGVVTHTAASDDALYDGITVGSVTVSIDENDSSGGGGSSRSTRAIQALTDTEPETLPPAVPLTPEQVQEAIVKVKQQLIIVIQQLIVLLQEEIAKLSR